MADPELMRDLNELEGKQLGCHCLPDDCHGQILLELLTKKPKSPQEPRPEKATPQSRDNKHTRSNTTIEAGGRWDQEGQRGGGHREVTHSNIDRNGDEPETVILMDSNSKHINFNKLFNNAKVIRCSTSEHAETQVKNLHRPKTVILHCGVNDIGNRKDIYDIANCLGRTARYAAQNYGAIVFISEITPFTQNQKLVDAANRAIRQVAKGLPEMIKAIPHPHLSTASLRDDRHLESEGSPDNPTAVEFLVDDIMNAVTGEQLSLRELKSTYRKPYYRRGNHMNGNVYY
jgi:hypothetical protein